MSFNFNKFGKFVKTKERGNEGKKNEEERGYKMERVFKVCNFRGIIFSF